MGNRFVWDERGIIDTQTQKVVRQVKRMSELWAIYKDNKRLSFTLVHGPERAYKLIEEECEHLNRACKRINSLLGK